MRVRFYNVSTFFDIWPCEEIDVQYEICDDRGMSISTVALSVFCGEQAREKSRIRKSLYRYFTSIVGYPSL